MKKLGSKAIKSQPCTVTGKPKNWEANPAEERGVKTRRGPADQGPTGHNLSVGGMPARRADPKALFSFVQRAEGKQQSFTNSTDVRMSSRYPTLEFTNSEVRSPSEKRGLKISWRAALGGASRKRCCDYAPVSRALSSAAARSPPRRPCPGQTPGASAGTPQSASRGVLLPSARLDPCDRGSTPARK